MILQPAPEGDRLAGQRRLQGACKDFFRRAVLRPLRGIAPGTAVGRDDPVIGRRTVLPPQIQPLPVPGTGNTGDLRCRGPGSAQRLADHVDVGLPQRLHIAFGRAGKWPQHGDSGRGGCDVLALRVKNHRLGDATAIIDTEEKRGHDGLRNRPCRILSSTAHRRTRHVTISLRAVALRFIAKTQPFVSSGTMAPLTQTTVFDARLFSSPGSRCPTRRT